MSNDTTHNDSKATMPNYTCMVAPLSFEEKEELRTRILQETSPAPSQKERHIPNSN